jgi:hypothetical protein
MNQNQIKKEFQIFKLVAKEAIEDHWYGNSIHISLILHEALNKNNITNKIETGYIYVDFRDTKFYSWHSWIEIENRKYDILTYITNSIFPEHKLAKRKLSKELLPGYELLEEGDITNIISKNIESLKIYNENPVKYWDTDVSTSLKMKLNFKKTKKLKDKILKNKKISEFS